MAKRGRPKGSKNKPKTRVPQKPKKEIPMWNIYINDKLIGLTYSTTKKGAMDRAKRLAMSCITKGTITVEKTEKNSFIKDF